MPVPYFTLNSKQCTPGRIRTDNSSFLRRSPLPLGYWSIIGYPCEGYGADTQVFSVYSVQRFSYSVPRKYLPRQAVRARSYCAEPKEPHPGFEPSTWLYKSRAFPTKLKGQCYYIRSVANLSNNSGRRNTVVELLGSTSSSNNPVCVCIKSEINRLCISVSA